MRKVVVAMAVSLDGFVATSDGGLDWIFPRIDGDMQAWILDSVARTDTQLIGRVNYQEQEQFWPNADGELAAHINAAEKIVFSSTLKSVDWKNARLAAGSLRSEIAALRRVEGRDILVPGGARLAQAVSRQGLVDEYRLIVHPTVLGAGLPLFTDPAELELQDCRTFRTGALALTYGRG